ncbi:MAG: hypothetical protein FWE82_03375 [Defluviitaleaceae bacterium]|nr:hypothetical protein [Defluviitaleaceae bacterium]
MSKCIKISIKFFLSIITLCFLFASCQRQTIIITNSDSSENVVYDSIDNNGDDSGNRSLGNIVALLLLVLMGGSALVGGIMFFVSKNRRGTMDSGETNIDDDRKN